MNRKLVIGFDIGEQFNHGSSPSGPWYWMYYIVGGLIIVSGFRLAKVRRLQHARNTNGGRGIKTNNSSISERSTRCY